MASSSESFAEYLQRLDKDLPVLKRVMGYWHESPWSLVAEWLVIWTAVYLILHSMRGARGARAVKLIATPLVLGALFFALVSSSENIRFARLSLLYNNFLLIIGLVLLVVFQPELRRSIAHLGEVRFMHFFRRRRLRMVDEVCAAVDYLAKNRIGALVAIERHNSLTSYLESATRLEAAVSKELLSTIFWPGSMLHDLGVVVRDEHVVAAGVQFPLADADLLPQQLGSRHRAALGLSLEVDALVVVVSEETGTISLAHKGQLKRHLSTAELRSLLERALPQPALLGIGKAQAEDPLAPAEGAADPAAATPATEDAR